MVEEFSMEVAVVVVMPVEMLLLTLPTVPMVVIITLSLVQAAVVVDMAMLILPIVH